MKAFEHTLKVLDFHSVVQQVGELAASAPGRARCMALRPETIPAVIESMQEDTEEALLAIERFAAPPLFGIVEQDRSFSFLRKGGVLSPGSLLRIGDMLRACRAMKDYISEEAKVDFPRLTDRTQRLVPMGGISAEIARIILSEDEIADDASPELKRIRGAKRKKESEVRDTLQRIVRASDTQKKLQDQLITVRDGRYVVPVRSEHRNSFPGIVHDQSGSGQTVFMEPMAVVKLNNELRELELEESAEIERILRMLSGLCTENIDSLESNQEILIELDFLFAKGRYASQLDATKPLLSKDGRLSAKQVRHPLLDPLTVVPIDLELGDDFTTIVITGPNTGGKTVSLKTLGLLSLMAQSGLHVPMLPEGTVPIFDAVYSDIGDEQSIAQSLSTFSSHMTNLIRILKEVTPRSLVLLDELGAGTDPVEGAALAMSILEHLRKQSIYTVATTHYSQLKLYALNTPGVKNASVEFDVATLRPTYRLQIGLPGKSNAFEISERLGLPKELIQAARDQVSQENRSFEDVLSRIEEEQQLAERAREESEKFRAEWNEKIAKLEARLEESRDAKRKAVEEGKKEAARILQHAKEQADTILEQLRNRKGQDDAGLTRARQSLRKALEDMEPSDGLTRVKSEEVPRDLRLGEEVEVLTMGQTGQVLTLPDKNGQITVQMGILKVSVQLDEVRRSEKSEKETGRARIQSILQDRGGQSVETKLDLRGLRVDEAIVKIDRFLDAALLGNVKQVEIIHGKGTGQLRAGVTEYLRTHPAVKTQRLGTIKEGGDGVTVVEI